jgi:hypothetical protein
MKIKLAGVLGLAVLMASFTCGGSVVYADAPEALSSAMQALAPDANANGTESVGTLPCAFTDDGAETCTVNAALAEVDQLSPAGAIEPSVTEASSTEATSTDASAVPAIQSVDAIVVEVTQTVTIAVPGQDEDAEAAVLVESVPEPTATEPVLVVANATIDAALASAIEADGIIVEVTQTATIAAPGQDAGNTEELAYTGSQPSATESILVVSAEATTDASLTPAIEPVDAVAVEVAQTVAAAFPGLDAGDCEGLAYTGSISEPAITEPVSTLDANGVDIVE